jgi:hypothetical protein
LYRQLAESVDSFLNRDQSNGQVLLFRLLQPSYLLAQESDSLSATSDKHSLALCSRCDPDDSTITYVLRFEDEIPLLQGIWRG